MSENRDGLLDPQATTTGSGETAGVERRRPGRREDVNPNLVGLLRQATPAADLLDERPDDLRAPTGLLVGAGVSALMWAGILLGLRSFIGG